MSTRPVFEVMPYAPYFSEQTVEFKWNRGLNINQQRKNVIAVHASYAVMHPERRILEISSRSLAEEGRALSAFKLMKFVPSREVSLPVENLYQGGKIFELGGPFTDMYDVPPMRAKKDERLHTLGHVTGFYFEGRTYSREHYDAFYNWLYINALMENPELAQPLLSYDGFTDLAFNPKKGKSCQARSAAIYVSLTKLGRLGLVRDFDSFVDAIYGNAEAHAGLGA